MFRRVALVRTDVSEEPSASFIRVTRIDELGTTQQHKLQLTTDAGQVGRSWTQIDQGHRIQFHNAYILATKTRYIVYIVREVIEIELHPYNINREGGFCLSKSWKPLIGSLKIFGTWPKDTRRHSSPFVACLHHPATLLPKLGTTLWLGPFKNQATISPPLT
jgi:hypothetical protein